MLESQESGGYFFLKFDRLLSVNHYEQIESIIQHLGENFQDQPSLEELSQRANLSPDHFQRVFKNWVGISPKQFLKYLTLEYAKSRLEQKHSILDSALDSGLSGPGRLHDLFVSLESITPGEYKQRGDGLHIEYGIHPSPFGFAVLAVSKRGLCGSFFLPELSDSMALEAILEYWPQAHCSRNDIKTSDYAKQLFDTSYQGSGRLSLFVRGTPFQVQVWRALLEIPSGSLCTYSDLAGSIGRPSATRAVASAVGDNPISWLIPCHRVIRKGGYLGGYRWGLARKKVMLAWEANQRAS